jgi:hypothetical protein
MLCDSWLSARSTPRLFHFAPALQEGSFAHAGASRRKQFGVPSTQTLKTLLTPMPGPLDWAWAATVRARIVAVQSSKRVMVVVLGCRLDCRTAPLDGRRVRFLVALALATAFPRFYPAHGL